MDRALEDQLLTLPAVPSPQLQNSAQIIEAQGQPYLGQTQTSKQTIQGRKRKQYYSESVQHNQRHKSLRLDNKRNSINRNPKGFRVGAALARRVKGLLGPDITNKDCNDFILKAIDRALTQCPNFLSEFKFKVLVKQSREGKYQFHHDQEIPTTASEDEAFLIDNNAKYLSEDILRHVHRIVMAELKVAKTYNLRLLWNKISRMSSGFSLESFYGCLEKMDDVEVEKLESGTEIVKLKGEPVDKNMLNRRASYEAKPFVSNMRFVSIMNWTARAQNQLSVQKGTQLIALGCEGSQMLVKKAQTQEIGYVPLSILFGVKK